MLIFTSAILLFSVISMRNAIKKITSAFPNEKLMIVHVVNFIVYSLLVIVDVSMLTQGRHYEPYFDDYDKGGEPTPECLDYLNVIYW